MTKRRRRVDEIPAEKCVVIGANIRIMRQRKGWTQAKIGELMGWPSSSTVCAAEGRRSGRQRGFTTDEVKRLAAIFGIPVWQLTTRCANCQGHPPAGFSCLTCGAGQEDLRADLAFRRLRVIPKSGSYAVSTGKIG
jgi:transcriptional regulator with XRE-family HTH domain